MTENLLLNQNRSIRVFISSTFRDMKSERDLFLKQIFPHLRKICAERHVELTEIDLRWGITEDEAKQGKVIEICLNEIDKSRPYFIGILGSRYGWVPDSLDENTKIKLLNTYPWLNEDLKSGLSITDIEMQYGVLRCDELKGHAFFYVKDDGLAGDIYEESEDDRKLRQLKEAVLKLPSTKKYKSIKELGKLAKNDFKRIIDEEFPKENVPETLTHAKLEQIAYIRSRVGAYIEPEGFFDILNKHVGGTGSPLVVTGPSGMGKSSLLCNWLVDYNSKNPEKYVFFHFCGCNSSSADSIAFITRLLKELKKQFHIQDDIPSDFTSMNVVLPEFLAQTGKNGHWTLLLDGVNQLSGDNSILKILPDSFPEFVRVILTTTEGACLEGLKNKRFSLIELPPLSKPEREQLIERYLSKYSKRLSSDLVEIISKKELLNNPLLMKSLLNELRIFGLHEGLGKHIDMLLSAKNADGFFDLLLERMELDYDNDRKNMTQDFMRAMLAARKGLAEKELMEFLSISRLKLSQIICALDQHLIGSGGLLNFSHAYLREAAVRRYFSDPDNESDTHKRLAAFFNSRDPLYERAIQELPYQYLKSKQFGKLKDTLTSPRFFTKLFEDEQLFLYSMWHEISQKYGEKCKMSSAYRKKATRLAGKEKANYAKTAGDFCMFYATYKDALFFYKMHLCENIHLQENKQTAAAYSYVANAYDAMGHYDRAIKAAEKSITILTEQDDHAINIDNYRIIANANFERGKYKKSMNMNFMALELCQKLLDENHIKTIECYREIAWNYEVMGDSKTAVTYMQNALKICRLLFGENHPQTADCYTNISWFCDTLGDYADAYDFAYKSYHICCAIFAPNHPQMGMALKLTGSAHYRCGDYEKALENYEKFKKIMQDTYPEIHQRVSQGYFQVGLACFRLKNYERALSEIQYSTKLDRLSETYKEDAPVNCNYAGMSYLMLGDNENAFDNLNRAYLCGKNVADEQVYDFFESCYFLGVYFQKQKYDQKALEYYNEALSVISKHYCNRHPEAGRCLYSIGTLLKKMGDNSHEEYFLKAKLIFDATKTSHIVLESDALLF